jgi:iron complex transport system ATP-binding protein
VSESVGGPVLELEAVTLVRSGRTILDAVTWSVRPGEQWAVLGPNGAGKTSLARIASLWLHPTSGSVSLLGRALGGVDVRPLRARVGLASAAVNDALRPSLTALDAVMTGARGALEPWWHHYSEADRRSAGSLLAEVGAADLAPRTLGTLSSGERQRVALARTLAADPAIVLLDEPTAGLDLVGREELVHSLELIHLHPDTPPTVVVTHHLDELPASTTHALLLRAGGVSAIGTAADVLRSAPLSECFGIDLEVTRHDGRWAARRRPDPSPRAG